MNCVIEKEIFWCSSPAFFMLLCVFRCTPRPYPRCRQALLMQWHNQQGKDALLQSLSQYFISYLHYSICLHISLFLKKYHIASWFQCSFQFSSVTHSCPTLCHPMDCSVPGLPVHHQLLEFTQTHVHWVSDAIQPSHPRSSPSLPTFNLSQHQGLS